MSKRVRDITHKRSGGMCELSGCHSRATNCQHRLPLGRGGTWTVSNVIDVCGMGNASGCHGWIHTHPIQAEADGLTIRTGGDPATTSVQLRYGRVFLLEDGSVVWEK